LRTWFPVNFYEIACWARSSTVPLLIVCDRQPVYDHCLHADELFAEGSRARAEIGLKNTEGTAIGAFFIAADRMLKLAAGAGLVPFRGRAIEAAGRGIIGRQGDAKRTA